ncbi:MAG TPA: hypothetical protein VMT32_10925 [Bryobacteraceae bacterium]|nr:hypothetical protein [Bryobacteraceae bacterium]
MRKIEAVRLSFRNRLLDRGIKHGPVFRIDGQQDIGEFRFLGTGREAKDMKSFLRPADLIVDEVKLPVADAGEFLHLDHEGAVLGSFLLRVPATSSLTAEEEGARQSLAYRQERRTRQDQI